MEADHWKSIVALAVGEELKHESHRMTGFMQEEDVDTYAIVGADGAKTGEVIVRDHTAVKGFRRSIRVTQVDIAGKQTLDTSYDVR